MVQEEVATPTGRRARNRLARHREYLRTALRIATEDGLDALTMQRLADEVDAAVGTVYTYFPSKGALVAEVQREAIERLTASYLLLRPDVEAKVADEAPSVAAVTHLVAFGRFWIDSFDSYPREQRLLQQLMSEAHRTVEDSEVGRVVPAALRLLDLARERFEVASQVGALSPAEPMERTVTLAASLSGVLQLGKLGEFDPDVLDGPRLATRFLDDLLAGWGARPDERSAGHAFVDAIARRHRLARALPEGDDT
ncbi:MAG: TetR/AcrR family transcriptional regulator [Actinomycetota bacterium]|nr:TetR/AcrR family transcriptional regulator [Actinomycetota bacterium]